jgi:hypothetical protein
MKLVGSRGCPQLRFEVPFADTLGAMEFSWQLVYLPV